MDPASKHILVAVAWPYAQGSLHLGHIAGAYLPPDIFSRYHRSIGNKVLMVSGSDVHGTPIAVKAEAEGVSPQEIIDRYHPEFLGYWEKLGIEFDLFTTTGTENHKRVAQDFFLRLLERGFLYRHTIEQFFDEQEGRFLPDRFIEGTCPHCGYSPARGDQCDNCGRTLDPVDLIEPRSKLSNTKPVLRETEHFYWKLSEFSEPLRDWLDSREGWRPHVLNFAKGMVDEGLHDRAFTRDLDWGIALPVDDLGPGKSIYVWWEAVMGYLSAPQEWAESHGDPDSWKAWWENPDAKSYYFVGKDNIPFHTVFWPALLLGYGGLNLPTNVPANHHLTVRGEKASKSRGVGKLLSWYLDHVEPDALRYAVAANFPETSDTDLDDDEIVRRINGELSANWGNLVNRAVSMTHRYFAGTVPEPGATDDVDNALFGRIDETIDSVGDLIEQARLRSALARGMAGAQEVNQYLSAREPWKTAASDLPRTATTLWVTLNAVSGLAAALSPFLPFTSRRVLETLRIAVPASGPAWKRVDVAPGTHLGEAVPLYARAEIGGSDDA
jgi:methionyl-tRNA synthetase